MASTLPSVADDDMGFILLGERKKKKGEDPQETMASFCHFMPFSTAGLD